MGFLSYINKTYHRNILEILLFKYKHLIKGKILDIGSRNRRYDYLFTGEITAVDVNPNSELKIVEGDLINLDFQSDTFDSVLCLEVFEYIEPDNFKKGFNEIHRVLKEEGNAIITIPFYYSDHEDTMRVTYRYILKYLKNLALFKLKIIKFGNKYTTFYDIVLYAKLRNKFNKLIHLILDFFLFIIYIVIKMFSLQFKKDRYYSGLLIILSKHKK